MKICDLPSGRKLHADNRGAPFYVCPPTGLRPAGYCADVLSHVNAADRDAVNAWQADPGNDCLRARGDLRWLAACAFTQRPVWEE